MLLFEILFQLLLEGGGVTTLLPKTVDLFDNFGKLSILLEFSREIIRTVGKGLLRSRISS